MFCNKNLFSQDTWAMKESEANDIEISLIT